MYYLTDRKEHMDPRCFGDLKLLVKTILIDDEREVIEHIDRGMKDEPNASIEVPYVGLLPSVRLRLIGLSRTVNGMNLSGTSQKEWQRKCWTPSLIAG